MDILPRAKDNMQHKLSKYTYADVIIFFYSYKIILLKANQIKKSSSRYNHILFYIQNPGNFDFLALNYIIKLSF